MTDRLVYTYLNTDKLVVRGDKDKYDAILKTIGGRWNATLKAGPGWVVEKSNELKLKKLIETLVAEPKLKQLKDNIKSRKDQKKFHRANSEGEFKKEKQTVAAIKPQDTKQKQVETTLNYYKKFKNSPPKKKVSSSDSSSSSPVYKKHYYASSSDSDSDSDSDASVECSDDDSQSSGFPSDEESPPSRKNIYKKMEELNKRVIELEHKNSLKTK